MKEYRRGSHSVFQLHVHLVWYTKYRKKVLVQDVGLRLRDLCWQICSDLGVEILSGGSRKGSCAFAGIDGSTGVSE